MGCWFGKLPSLADKTVVTIGVFDSVHLGHQCLLREVKRVAEENAALPLAVTFDQHPLAVLTDNAPALLSSLDERVQLIEKTGVSVLVIPFTRQLASLSAGEFVRDFLGQELRASHLLLGENARLGADHKTLSQLAAEWSATSQAGQINFMPVSLLNTAVSKTNIPRTISSSEIRQAIQQGQVTQAAEYLGRYYSVHGIVEFGKKLGGTLGFPTLNIRPPQKLLLPEGVYISQVRWQDTSWPAVTSIAQKPAGIDRGGVIVESHLLENGGYMYGLNINVDFIQYLRPMQQFADLEQLRRKIAADTAAAREFFQLERIR